MTEEEGSEGARNLVDYIKTLLLTVWYLWTADQLVISPSSSHRPLYVLLTSFTAFIVWSTTSAIFRFLFVLHVWSVYSLVYGPCFLLGGMILVLDRQMSGSFLLLALGLLSICDGLLKLFSFLPKPLPRPPPQPAPAPPPRPSSASCSHQPQFFYIPLQSDAIVPLDKYPDFLSHNPFRADGAMSSSSVRAAVDAVLSGISSGDNSEVAMGSFSGGSAPPPLPTPVSVGSSLLSTSHGEASNKNQVISETSSDSL